MHNVLQISEGKDLERKIIELKTNIIMKTRTSIYHRTFAFAYVLLVAVIFGGCGEQIKEQNRSIEQHNTARLYTYTYDSCEYVGTYLYNSSATMTHKGNCRFCAERSKK